MFSSLLVTVVAGCVTSPLVCAGLESAEEACGGVGVVVDLPPDMISSVISRPPWLGSRILIGLRSLFGGPCDCAGGC